LEGALEHNKAVRICAKSARAPSIGEGLSILNEALHLSAPEIRSVGMGKSGRLFNLKGCVNGSYSFS